MGFYCNQIIDRRIESNDARSKMMYYPFVHTPRLVLWQALLYWDALWLKRSVWVLGAFGAAPAGTVVPPLYASLLVAMSGPGISVATAVTRPGVPTEFAYLQHLQAAFSDAAWPSAPPTR
jgi:hypothetical protein